MTRIHAQVRENLMRLRTTDAILSCPTPQELRDWYASTGKMSDVQLGRVYDGIAATLGALEGKDREQVLSRLDAQREIGFEGETDPGSPTRKTADATPKTIDAFRPNPDFVRSLNEAAAKRWER